eukprot:TRINITY_DN19741_c0_g1_i1.p1 TRINITY_DN19741_c0_g1~~TRINITY_DN19741_c0_g1_i1.p1  ORF type:complete len:466 (-),score=128.44 TRINITY_DN19741_c0_g1_i1:974-2221(-)
MDTDEPSLLFDEQSAVTKNAIFEELTEEQQAIIKQRVAQHQQKVKDFESRQAEQFTKKIQAIHPHVTTDEANAALKECNGDEQELVIFLTDHFNLQGVRKDVALAAMKEEEEQRKESAALMQEMKVPEPVPMRIRNKPSKSRKRGDAKEGKIHQYRKLRLDDALKQGNFEGWSVARMNAYKMREKNPNSYYYRFNDPGEPQRNGKWTDKEVKMFYDRMKEVGVDGNWGIFATKIPGRVGYQCSNFYRGLIESGAIVDPNYVLDEKGKAHYIFKKTRLNGEKPDGTTIRASKETRKRGKKRKTDKKDDDEDEDGDDDESYRPTGRVAQKTSEDLAEEMSAANPLPDMLDPITMCPVERPAISPYGHVASYQTWIRCLQESKNICPFTKKTLKKRDLILLTWDNIEEHRADIVDIQK